MADATIASSVVTPNASQSVPPSSSGASSAAVGSIVASLTPAGSTPKV